MNAGAGDPAAHPRRVVLAGGSGFLGASLARALRAQGRTPVILTRSPTRRGDGVVEIAWDGRTVGEWTRWLDGAEGVVNLTGKNVNCRPTERNRREITASRVDSVRAIGEAFLACAAPPPAWIQASSLALYGDTGERICGEDEPVATGYPADVVTAWEDAVARCKPPGVRGVVLRIGIVFARDGGALPVLAGLARKFLGGSAGNGRQWISWMHLADADALFLRALDDPALQGAYNACAGAVRNGDLMRALRHRLHRPWIPPAPRFAVRIGAFLMGTDPGLIFVSRRCEPKRLVAAGFTFARPDLAAVLAEAVG